MVKLGIAVQLRHAKARLLFHGSASDVRNLMLGKECLTRSQTEELHSEGALLLDSNWLKLRGLCHRPMPRARFLILEFSEGLCRSGGLPLAPAMPDRQAAPSSCTHQTDGWTTEGHPVVNNPQHPEVPPQGFVW